MKTTTKHLLLTPNLVIAACIALAFSGCDTLKAIYKAGTTGVSMSASGDPGVVHDDKILIHTEQALAISLDTFNTFLKIERANKTEFDKVSPEIHKFAENIRRNGKGWIKSAEKAHDAYRDNRTSQNYANLVTAYNVLKTAIAESQKYIEKHSGV